MEFRKKDQKIWTELLADFFFVLGWASSKFKMFLDQKMATEGESD